MEQRVPNGAGKPRAIRTEEQIVALLEEFDSSGYTVKEFCEVSDLNEATFYSWLRKYRQRAEE
jgi:transposase-like protein